MVDHGEVLGRLKALSDPEAVHGMVRFGIDTRNAYGVSVPALRKMAREIGRDHALAQELWATGVHEARILASMIDDPKAVTEEQMEQWVGDFDSWDICDQCCSNLFDKTGADYRKAAEWSLRDEEFVGRAGFALMAALAVHDKSADDERFLRFLPIIKERAVDDRNFVEKAVNWALRQIGKRNVDLNRRAIETSKEILKIDSRSAKWIANDAFQELTSEAVQRRLAGGDNRKTSEG